MKARQGFVSNSSSSSFVLHTDEITPEQFQQDIEILWVQACCDGECTKDTTAARVSRFIQPSKMDKKKAQEWITAEYAKEYWDAKEKISHRKRGRLTYLNEALKADIFGVAEENALPYQVLEKLREKYGSSLTIHHLG